MLADIGAELDAVIDPGLVRFHAAEDLMAARADAAARTNGLIDPDDIEARLGAAAIGTQTLRIAAGQSRNATIAWTPP